MTPPDTAAPQDLPARPEATAVGVGQALRQLRESRGWTLAEVSARLKFSPRQIEALEAERWQALPQGVSLRGLVRNYARLLGVDPETMMAALAPHLGSPPASPVRSMPHARPAPAMQHEERSGGSAGWLIIILVVLAVAVGYAFWQGWLPTDWLPVQWFPRSDP